MTREWAINALEEGKQITHIFFTPDEWVKKYDNERYITEDGYITAKSIFWSIRPAGSNWDTGWSEV